MMSTAPCNPLLSDSSSGSKKSSAEHYWLWVMCLLGLDYFSTLAYQPSITYHETKRLGPLATAAVVTLPTNASIDVPGTIGDGPTGALDVDLFKIAANAGDIFAVTLNSVMPRMAASRPIAWRASISVLPRLPTRESAFKP